MRPPAISLDQLASLPAVYRAVIPPADEDRQGHMNMRWYLALYDEAGDAMYPMLGLTADYFAASCTGGFDLEHHLWYPSEVRIGETVVIRVRILARNLKLFHYMMFMANETRGVLSSLFECVHAHADLRTRRTAPFPAQVAAQIDAMITEHRALTWPAPVSGSMGLKAAHPDIPLP
jgi:acyl-CoA thioester hydrolase